MMRYSVVLEWDDEGQGWIARVPALPGCLTQGSTVDEAMANVQEAAELHIEGLLADGEPIPREHEPTVLVNQVVVKAA